MARLAYSEKALSALRYFHGTDIVVYVEGRDDIPFWEIVLRECGLQRFKVKIAGDCEQVERYTRAIVDSGADIAVARDTDFGDLLGHLVDHGRILYTHGYAIENSLCEPGLVGAFLQAVARLDHQPAAEVTAWLNETLEALRELVERDVAVRRAQGGAEVPLDNAARYLSRSARPRIDGPSVLAAVAAIDDDIEKVHVEVSASLIASSGKPLMAHVRGHFLISAVALFVRARARSLAKRRVTLSNDAVFGGLLAGFSVNRLPGEHAEHYKASVQKLTAALASG